MKYQRRENSIVGRIVRGEEVMEQLLNLLRDNSDVFGSIVGLGAADDIEISIYDVGQKRYHRTHLQEATEVTNLTGFLGRMDGEPYGHVHATFGRASGAVVGGHLNRAVVSGTIEFAIQILPFDIERFQDAETGLNLLSIE